MESEGCGCTRLFVYLGVCARACVRVCATVLPCLAYHALLSTANADGTFDVTYADGDFEAKVDPAMIYAQHGPRSAVKG